MRVLQNLLKSKGFGFVQEVHGNNEIALAKFFQFNKSHRIFYDYSGNVASGGLATFVPQCYMSRLVEPPLIQYVEEGRIHRILLKLKDGIIVLWNWHQFAVGSRALSA
eukprot:10822136-Karenia_brevis.AAC.1